MTTVDVFVRSVETWMEIHEEDANLCNHGQGLHNGSHWFATMGVSHARRARLLVYTRCQVDWAFHSAYRNGTRNLLRVASASAILSLHRSPEHKALEWNTP